MKIKFNKTELTGIVKKHVPFVERKSTIPILANLLFSAAGSTLRITSTDLQDSLTTEHDAAIESEGRVTVPARKLGDILAKLKTLKSETVTLETVDSKGKTSDAEPWIQLTCGSLVVKIAGMKAINFPFMPKPSAEVKTLQVDGTVLQGLIDRVRHNIATEESRYTLNGALLVAEPARLRMVATDGHRLGLAEHVGEFTPMRALLQSSTLDKAYSFLAGSVSISPDENVVYITGEGYTITARLLTGQFPNYEAVLPRNNGKVLELQGKALKESLGRVAAFADERSHAVHFELQSGKGLKLSASNSELGDAEETLETSCDHNMVIGFSAAYVSDILATLDKEQTVRIAFNDHQSPGMFTPVEPNGFSTKYVLMPMRI